MNAATQSYLVLGDIHNEYLLFAKAHSYATANNLHIVSVGDVVDYGTEATSTIAFASLLLRRGQATFIEGNHDNKINRYLNGNDVKMSYGMNSTVGAVADDEVKNAFLYLYDHMKTHVVIGDTHITHGAFTSSYWTDGPSGKKFDRSRLYGEVDKNKPTIEYNGFNYPARTYEWVNDIPAGKTVIVGHDRSPFSDTHVNMDEVVTRLNDQGGTAIFTDTGAGKGGFISGVVLSESGSVQEIVKFKDWSMG
jgi:hypothetical protein